MYAHDAHCYTIHDGRACPPPDDTVRRVVRSVDAEPPQVENHIRAALETEINKLVAELGHRGDVWEELARKAWNREDEVHQRWLAASKELTTARQWLTAARAILTRHNMLQCPGNELCACLSDLTFLLVGPRDGVFGGH